MSDESPEPTVSVIVPVYNDPDGIETTLQSLVDQEYPDDDHEILAVDNGSTDETANVIDCFAERYEPVVSLTESAIQGSYAARNRGVEHASGEFIAFIDADMWVDSDWIESVVRVATTEGYDYFGCDVEIVPVNEPPTLAERYNMVTGFPVEEYVEESHFAPTCCLVVHREVLKEVGLFDERLLSGGDKEFGKRVQCRGFSQGYVPDITMYHPARGSFFTLFKKAFRIGRGRAQLGRYHGEEDFEKLSLLSSKQYIPPNPRKFYSKFKYIKFQNYEKMLVYVGEYLILLSGMLGQIFEYIHDNR